MKISLVLKLALICAWGSVFLSAKSARGDAVGTPSESAVSQFIEATRPNGVAEPFQRAEELVHRNPALVNVLFPSTTSAWGFQGQRPLHLALLRHSNDWALWLLQHGASIELLNARGQTALQCAVEAVTEDQYFGVQLCVAALRAQPDQPKSLQVDAEGNTLAHLLAQRGLIAPIIGLGADWFAPNNAGITPLQSVIMFHSVSARLGHQSQPESQRAQLLALLERKEIKNRAANDLFVQVFLNDARAVERLTQAQPEAVSLRVPSMGWTRYQDSGTPLALAVELGHLEVARILLDHGADARGNPSSFSLLALTVMDGNEAMAQLLLDHGADINQRFGFFYSSKMLDILPSLIKDEATRERMRNWLLAHGAKTAYGPDAEEL